MEIIRPTWVEIDLKKLKNNFDKIKKISGGRKIIGVVKADAYGHGAEKISKALEEWGIDFLAVASFEEAMRLRRAGIKKTPVLVLGYVNPSALKEAAINNIHITLFNVRFIEKLHSYEGKHTLNVHINVDTGMGRIGVFPEEVLDTANEIKNMENVNFFGIYTHFSTADSDPEYLQVQLARFKRILYELGSRNIKPKLIHAANSAAILNFNETLFDAVRPGIILYGLSPFQKDNHAFEPVLSFKTRVIYVKRIPSGTSISYGRRFISKKKMIVATIPVGYADGLPRALSNKGEVLIKGKRVKILGNVTMDQTVIDVSGIPNVHSGNEVVLIGKQGDEEITATEIAKKIGTINYEIISRIGKRVERIYIK
ncbi:MAG: alanine racemase [Caldisericaceae bacterium]|nr:alanine racemase [Caldisericaceae bacterium]